MDTARSRSKRWFQGLAHHVEVRVALAIGGFILLSWPFISSMQGAAPGSIQQHLYISWALLIFALYLMRNPKESESIEAPEAQESPKGETCSPRQQ